MISGHISRRGFIALASGLLLPAPARVREYSFVGFDPGYEEVTSCIELVELDYAGLEARVLRFYAMRKEMQRVLEIYGQHYIGPPLYSSDG